MRAAVLDWPESGFGVEDRVEAISASFIQIGTPETKWSHRQTQLPKTTHKFELGYEATQPPQLDERTDSEQLLAKNTYSIMGRYCELPNHLTGKWKKPVINFVNGN